LAIEQTSDAQDINADGAIDMETGQNGIIDALSIVDAAATIRLWN
jgi:hypothetical protein